MLNEDLLFVAALRGNAGLMALTEGRIFNTDRTEADDKVDKIPYIIITYDQASANMSAKDYICASFGEVSISILAVASRRKDLANLTSKIHEAIKSTLDSGEIYDDHDDWHFFISGAEAQASSVFYDIDKPCFFQTITYNCKTQKV